MQFEDLFPELLDAIRKIKDEEKISDMRVMLYTIKYQSNIFVLKQIINLRYESDHRGTKKFLEKYYLISLAY